MEEDVFKVISASDAATFLKIKDSLPRKTLVAVLGKVTAVSEIVRISKDYVFLIELDKITKVVVKQPQYHTWHPQLQVGQIYIFTNLRPTTLSKNHDSPEKMYVPWTGSKVLDKHSQQFVQVPLKEWLQAQGLALSAELEVDLSVPESQNSDSLTSYQGIVTDTTQGGHRIYTLDNSVRLFLCFLPQLKHQNVLEVGDKISVQNAHLRTCPVTGEKQLFCCMKSSLCAGNSTGQPKVLSATAHKKQRFSLTPPLSLLSSLTFTAAEVQPLIRLHEALSRTLGRSAALHNRHGESVCKIRETLQVLTGHTVYQQAGRCPRNYILEFCRHDFLCPLAISEGHASSQIPVPALVRDFTEAGDSASDGSTSRNIKTATVSNTEAVSDEDVWSSETKNIMEEDKRPLLGWLEVSAQTGHIQLRNAAETQDIVVTDSVSSAVPHECGSACQNRFTCPGDRLLCPNLHHDYLGHLIAVVRYCVVREMFWPSGTSQGLPGMKPENVTQTRHYVLCSAQDCVSLQRLDHPPAVASVQGYKSCETPQDRCQKPSSELVLITSKQFLCASKGKNRDARPQFTAEGQLLIEKRVLSGDYHTAAGQSREVDIMPVQEKRRRLAHKTCHTAGRMSSEGLSSSGTKSRASSSTAEDSPCSLSFQRSKHITLNFHDDNCKWFDVIHPPGVYRISGEGENPALVWPDNSDRLQQAIERAGTRTTVDVAQGACIGRAYEADAEVQIEDVSESSRSLESVLSEGQSKRLVSFKGEIIWRHHPPSQFTEFKTVGELVRNCRHPKQNDAVFRTLSSYLGDRCLCVGVRDPENSAVTANVYFNTQTMAYPLGLLPGVTVQFLSVEKKVSKAERAYFTFLPVSNLRICSSTHSMFSAVPSTSGERLATKRGDWDSTPTELFVHQWLNPQPPEAFVAQCHICQFFRVSLKSVCGICRANFGTTGCSAPACNNTEQSTLSARFSVLVEDGSCQALVSVGTRTSPDVPRKLLSLSESEWHHLETAVQQQGELFLQEFGNFRGSPVEEFVSQLCDSLSVKRPCSLLLHKPPVYSRKPEAKDNHKAAVDLLTFDDLKLRKISTGEMTVETLCLPYLQLDCLDIREI